MTGARSLALRRRYLRRQRLTRLSAVLPYLVSALAVAFIGALVAGML